MRVNGSIMKKMDLGNTSGPTAVFTRATTQMGKEMARGKWCIKMERNMMVIGLKGKSMARESTGQGQKSFKVNGIVDS